MKKYFSLILLATFLSFASMVWATPDDESTKLIRGGRSYDSAIPVEFNRDHSLDHSQSVGVYDYFFVDLDPGTLLTLKIRTLSKFDTNNNKRIVSTEPSMGLKLQNEAHETVQTLAIRATPNQVQTTTYRNRSAVKSRFYILVGSDTDVISSGNAVFQLNATLFSYGDLGVGRDAAAQKEGSFPVKVGPHVSSNSIGGPDTADLFWFAALQGEWYTIAIHVQDRLGVRFHVTVRDPYEKPLFTYTSGAKWWVVTHAFQVPMTGAYYVEVSLDGSAPEVSAYTLDILPVQVSDDKPKRREIPDFEDSGKNCKIVYEECVSSCAKYKSDKRQKKCLEPCEQTVNLCFDQTQKPIGP